MPADLVTTPGTAPRIAEWDHPLVDPNLEDAGIAHKLSSLARVPGLSGLEARYRRRFRHKSWQYMTATSEHVFVAFVIGTAGFAGNAFVYVVEPKSGAMYSKFAITPLGRGVSLAPSSAAGSHQFRGQGIAVDIDNLDGGRRFVARVSAPGIEVDLTYTSAPTDEHHVGCVDLADRRWNYSHKYNAFAVEGTVVVGGKTLTLARDRAFGTLDFTKSYALRHAVWRWIALAGRDRDGHVVGINLVEPTPDAPFSENAVWIDGKRHPLANVRLACDHPDDPRGPWRLTATSLDAGMRATGDGGASAATGLDAGMRATGDGAASAATGLDVGMRATGDGGASGTSFDVGMRAIAHVEQRLDVPLVKHRLRHVVGSFSGAFAVAGHTHELVDLVGIAEDCDTWW